jgi:hypothetical protein
MPRLRILPGSATWPAEAIALALPQRTGPDGLGRWVVLDSLQTTTSGHERRVCLEGGKPVWYALERTSYAHENDHQPDVLFCGECRHVRAHRTQLAPPRSRQALGHPDRCASMGPQHGMTRHH